MDKKFNEPPANIMLEKWGVSVKPYLTMSEIYTIGEGAVEKSNYVEEIMWINQSLLSCCVIDENFEDFDYDCLNAQGFFDDIKMAIRNYQELKEYIQRRTSIQREMAELIKVVKETIPKLEKKVPSNRQFTKLIAKIQDKIVQNEYNQ